MEEENSKDRCKEEIAVAQDIRSKVPSHIDQVISKYDKEGRFHHIVPEPIPSRQAIVDIISKAFLVLFPGYFSEKPLDEINAKYYIGQEMTELFDMLSLQIAHAIRHDCIRFNKACIRCEERSQEIALDFVRAIPELQQTLSKDVMAAFEGDPASKYYDEIIFCYPGLYAIAVYRVAHWLHVQGVPLVPRIMTEYAHSRTGIDIHPGVTIGESFFIDHGTGVVVGETTIIGDRVRIYQGVTLGALSLTKEECVTLRGKKRHPTIEDDVIIYSNATILGGETTIGARSVIGGNVWLVESVPADTMVFLKKPELVVKNRTE
ncbi:MAG TPA: serine O-acetyltransferase EpsC [Syntrophorhabdaceae bacterium]|nr:serine O-acetyltransferase EpsC [Syntrophorhabdaceae bacterium]